VLPTGEVLATGGTGGTTGNDLTQAAHAAEVWNPSTGQCSTLASNVVSRGYHATSILLPDGRVLHSGSGDASNQVDERNAEIFSPPYLFHGPRPVITAAPAEAHYGTYAKVSTPDPAAITRVTLIRLGAATHAFDMGQRFQQLSFSRTATQIKAAIPASRTARRRGTTCSFCLLNARQVPSVGAIGLVK
jgi:galactose oxidase-like protein